MHSVPKTALLLAALALNTAQAQTVPVLGSDLASFAVFSGTGVTNATTNYAPLGSTELTNTTVLGNLGTTNTTDSGITGFFGAAQYTGPGTVDGGTTAARSANSSIYQGTQANDTLGFSAQAQLVDSMAALNGMQSQSIATYGNLAGMVLAPGVYSLTGVENLGVGQSVTLDGQGLVNPSWVFLASSSIVMQTYSTVNLIGGATANNVYWNAISSVTLNTGAQMAGNFLASTSITMGANVSLCGRALAFTGDVTMISDTISCGGESISSLDVSIPSVPEPGTYAMLLAGLALVATTVRRRVKSNLPS